MKTVREWIESEYGLDHLITILEMQDGESLFGIMQEYGNYLAKVVAEQTLKDAAERAEANVYYHREDHGEPSAEVEKESILSTPIKTL